MKSEGESDGRLAAQPARATTHAASKKKRRGAQRGTLQDAALATLDKFSRGVFLIQGDGAVSFANRAAKAMLARGDGLVLSEHRLGFSCESTQAELQSFLDNDEYGAGESLVLCTKDMSQDCTYRVLVSRLENGAGCCVFVYEANGGPKPLPVQVLQGLYRLTPAEARLTNDLFAGKTLEEAARVRGISVNTAKSALKNIFQKCEVRSRAELMLLLSLGPRTL